MIYSAREIRTEIRAKVFNGSECVTWKRSTARCTGHAVMRLEGEAGLSPCSHTYFIATEEELEDRTSDYDAACGLTWLDAEEAEERVAETAGDLDSFTDQLDLRNSVKLAFYAPAPMDFGAYYGFVWACPSELA